MNEQRSNVILMGDILEDAEMACDSKHSTVFRVGFLNSTSEEKLAKFGHKFDLVICDDGSLCPIIHLLHVINNQAGEINP